MRDNSKSQIPISLHLSWDQFHRDARSLALKLQNQEKFSALLCITRGGLVPAAIVARELGLRLIETICVSSYTGQEKNKTLQLLKPISDDIFKHIGENGEKALIIDDLVDTGKTLQLVKELLPKSIIATVYAKPEAKNLVDVFVTEVSQDSWIYFPWDLGYSFQPPLGGREAE